MIDIDHAVPVRGLFLFMAVKALDTGAGGDNVGDIGIVPQIGAAAGLEVTSSAGAAKAIFYDITGSTATWFRQVS